MNARWLTSLLVLALFIAPLRAEPGGKDLPVDRIVLFSSGVGYFQHEGKVSDTEQVELLFKERQINDVLKSLVVQDLDGGTVSTVVYPSQEPIERLLKSFGVDISSNPSLAQLLNQLRGASVKVTLSGNDQAEGTVLGIETREKPAGDENTIKAPVLNLVGSSGLRSIWVDEIRLLRLEDTKLQGELNKALAALAGARDTDRKPVVLDFQGKGDRRVRLGYVVETPVWKTSYRLVLPGKKNDKPFLQGWAIVENQTDHDWQNVTLSLVSGRPISFVQNLYSPIYIPRPVHEPRRYASLRPQEYQDGLTRKTALARSKERADGRFKMDKALGLPSAAATAPAKIMASDEQAGDLSLSPGRGGGVSSVAQAAQLGENFHYAVPDVTLPRRRSAMLPIVTDPISARRVSIYNRSVLAGHPLRGARLTNNTGKHLLAGPITIFDAGAYAGDASIGDLGPNDERLISYAVDLDVIVNTADKDQSSSLLAGKIERGVLRLQHQHIRTRNYEIKNQADKDRRLVVEAHRLHGWELVDSPEPVEKTDRLYRFEQEVKAGKQMELVIRQQRVAWEAIALLNTNESRLLYYARNTKIDSDVRKALQKAADLRRAIAGLERQINETNQEIQTITREQKRLRENMRTVDRNSKYYNRLLNKLDDQETTIESRREQIESLTEARDAKRKEFEDYLKNLNVD